MASEKVQIESTMSGTNDCEYFQICTKQSLLQNFGNIYKTEVKSIVKMASFVGFEPSRIVANWLEKSKDPRKIVFIVGITLSRGTRLFKLAKECKRDARINDPTIWDQIYSALPMLMVDGKPITSSAFCMAFPFQTVALAEYAYSSCFEEDAKEEVIPPALKVQAVAMLLHSGVENAELILLTHLWFQHQISCVIDKKFMEKSPIERIKSLAYYLELGLSSNHVNIASRKHLWNLLDLNVAKEDLAAIKDKLYAVYPALQTAVVPGSKFLMQ